MVERHKESSSTGEVSMVEMCTAVHVHVDLQLLYTATQLHVQV